MKCNHDKLSFRKFVRGEQSYSLSRRNAGNYAPIRIVFDNSFLVASENEIKAISSLLNYVKSRLSAALSVIPISGNLLVPQTCAEYWTSPPMLAGKCAQVYSTNPCGEVSNIPADHLGPITVTSEFGMSRTLPGGSGVPNADLLIYTTASNTATCGNWTLAYASMCYMDQTDRPIVGNINFCLKGPLFTSLPAADQREVVLHECIHVLGFSLSLLSFFRDASGAPRTPRCPGASGCTPSDPTGYPPYNAATNSYALSPSTLATVGAYQYVVTPAVAAVAQAYFACPSAAGAPLEDHGAMDTAGSHWKERMLFTELMTGELNPGFTPVLSEFTLALFSDSGWYRVNYSAADAAPPMLWGR